MRAESVSKQTPKRNRSRPAGASRGADDRLTWVWVASLAVFTVLHRVVPRLLGLSNESLYFWNLMPVGAMGLFAGAQLRSRYALLVPPAAMLAADLLLIRPLAALGYPSFTAVTPFIYLSYALCALLGRLVGRDETSPVVLGGVSLLASVQFFLVTNFAVWLLGDGTNYPRTFAGLAECYLMAVPFFRNTVAGDLLFTGLFFGLHALAVRLPATREVRPAG
jgi:hypothetical protein